ncbi:MAG: LysR family transcriptional regulator [Burkholderiales bacterium]|nr:LysR family transcriptional regulator [Burkholderiales bacterium]
MHVRDLDLNLLHVFAAVHETRNVSRAAERLSLSQPAVSHALTRLRLALHDPLFVRGSGGVVPTPKADRFATQVVQALQTLDVALNENERFVAARSVRRFAVHMSDIGADEFLPRLMADVGRAASGVCIEAAQLAPEAIAPALHDGRLDLAVGFLPGLSGTESAVLLDNERYVALVRRGHPLARRLKQREALEQLEFILVASHIEPARALHLLGLQSRVRLTLPYFTVAPAIIAKTDLAMVMPSSPAERFARRFGLAVAELQLGLPPITVTMHWTWRHANDGGHRWLRERLLALRPPRR